jgi:hypothetical protein
LPSNHHTAKQLVKVFKGLTLDFEKAIFVSIADPDLQASEARIKKKLWRLKLVDVIYKKRLMTDLDE